MQFCAIDEAGLGPLLGPLSLASCRSNAAPEHLQGLLEDLDFWPRIGRTTHRTVCNGRAVRNGRTVRNGRIVRNDEEQATLAESKAIYRGSGGFARLERLALSLYLGAGKPLGFNSDIWSIFSEAECREFLQIAWYRDFFASNPGNHGKLAKNFALEPLQVPLAVKIDEVIVQAQLLRDQLAMRGWTIALDGLLLSERHLNHHIERCNNKSLVLQAQVAQLLHNYADGLLADDWQSTKRGDDDAQSGYCVIDRLGGRKYYRPWLEQIFADWQVETLCETARRSEYRLLEGENHLFFGQNSGRRAFDLYFWVDGDSRNILCAIASVWAKYRREVLMRQFNRYWQQTLHTVPQTSGYYRDAQPFLCALKAEYGHLPEDLLRIR